MGGASNTGRTVRDNPDMQCFELDTGAGWAIATYRWDGDLMVILHTEVPPTLQRQGIGGNLVKGVLEEARRRKLKLIPLCWFVREFVERNPEYADVMASAWSQE